MSHDDSDDSDDEAWKAALQKPIPRVLAYQLWEACWDLGSDPYAELDQALDELRREKGISPAEVVKRELARIERARESDGYAP